MGRTPTIAYLHGCSYVDCWLGLSKAVYLTACAFHLQHGGLRAVSSHMALDFEHPRRTKQKLHGFF